MLLSQQGETPPAILALADGTVFVGTSIGATGSTSGEVVFNTALTGYQETPTVNTTGDGTFELTIADNDTAINFRLTYADLSGPPAAARR